MHVKHEYTNLMNVKQDDLMNVKQDDFDDFDDFH